MRDHICSIYVLFNKDGVIDYVGRTSRPPIMRMYEHKQVLGYLPKYEIVGHCSTNCRLVEKMWIDFYRESGHALRNVNYGQGTHFASPETREKISKESKRRPNTWGAKISATQKGVKKNWSPEGEERIRATRFKKGHSMFNAMTDEQKAIHRKSASDKWNDPERRKRMSKCHSAKNSWAYISDERKVELKEKCRNRLLSIPDVHRRGAAALLAKDPDNMKRRMNKFWEEIRKDPVRYREYIDNRAASIARAKGAKKSDHS